MNETRGLPIARVTPRVGPPRRRSASFLWRKIWSRRTIDRLSDRIGLGAGHEFRRTSSSDTALRRPVCHLLCLCLCRVSVFSLSRHRNCSGALSFRRVWCCVYSPVFKWGYKIRIPDGIFNRYPECSDAAAIQLWNWDIRMIRLIRLFE